MSEDGTPRRGRSFGTSRLEAFSDGVFAIAITLLVLDVALRPPGTPLEQVLHAWPSYLAYAVSFLTIGAAWLAHVALTDRLTRGDPLLLRLNLLVLLFVAFLPFPTRLVAEALNDANSERVFVTMYGLTLLAIRLCGYLLDEYARREHLYATGPGNETDEGDPTRNPLGVAASYVVAILVGFVAPTLAVAFYFGIAVYLVVPFRAVARLLFRRK